MFVQYAPTLEVSVWDHKEGLGKSIKLGDAKLKVHCQDGPIHSFATL